MGGRPQAGLRPAHGGAPGGAHGGTPGGVAPGGTHGGTPGFNAVHRNALIFSTAPFSLSGVATGVNEKSAVGKTVFLLKSENPKTNSIHTGTREPPPCHRRQ